MATERQIAANRLNARRSTGPKTPAGKRRASGNAYRHGLSIVSDDLEHSEDAKLMLVRMIGDSKDECLIQVARAAVRAHLDLVRVRQTKANMINLVIEFGGLKAPPPVSFRSATAVLRYLEQCQPFVWPKPDPLAPMPEGKMECAAEAIRRVLPELRKLDRYEVRAYAAKEGALRAMSLRLSEQARSEEQARCKSQNEPQFA
jgi:hypothetical protein